MQRFDPADRQNHRLADGIFADSAYIGPMQTILIILLIAAMGATVYFLIRGIVQFLKTTEQDLMGDGPNMSGHRQNKAMQGRIAMQAVAVVICVLLLLLMGR